jgi:hypothetical protein
MPGQSHLIFEALSSTLYIVSTVADGPGKAVEGTAGDENHIRLSRGCGKREVPPEVSSDLCQDIVKGGRVFVIPGCLSERDTSLGMKRVPKEGDQAVETEKHGRGAVNGQIRPLALGFDAPKSPAFFKGGLNGAITNDKFCMTRQGRLQLSHHHLPLRLRSQHSEDCLRYPPKKPFDNGGTYEEKPMEASSAVSCDAGCSTSLGSGLSESPALDPMPSFTAGDQTCCQGSTGGVR